MKKTVFTLNINNYEPEICKLTYPFLKLYADKIEADFVVITERKFPHLPVTCEKFQIYELGSQMGNDWNIYLDSDTIVHPETPDWTNFIGKDTVLGNKTDFANVRFKYNKYFRRDGRNIGYGSWNVIASDWCIDLWKPTNLTAEYLTEQITLTVEEYLSGCFTSEHLIDDYLLSYNTAKYGLKYTTITELKNKMFPPESGFYHHQYLSNKEQKLKSIKETLKAWNLERYLNYDVQIAV